LSSILRYHHILRDRRTMLILLGMPMAQIIIFGFALTNEVKNSKVAVLDHARDLASIAITRKIDASRYFNIEKELSRFDQIEPAFREGKIKLAVIFPQGFNEDLLHYNKAQVQLIADASDPNVANTLTNYASSIIINYQDRLTNGQQLPYTIHTEVRMLYNPGLKGAYSFVPGVMAMVLMLVCTMMTAITIVREKEMGTMEILLVSPISPLKVIIAKAIPYLFFSIVNIISILLLSVFVLDVPINGSVYLLMAVSILFALTSLSLIDLCCHRFPANCHVHFAGGVVFTNGNAEWLYVPHRKYANPAAGDLQCCTGKMVLYHCKISNDKGRWILDDLETSGCIDRDDAFFSGIEQ
jgi:ABC-2 type transport system permease protein